MRGLRLFFYIDTKNKIYANNTCFRICWSIFQYLWTSFYRYYRTTQHQTFWLKIGAQEHLLMLGFQTSWHDSTTNTNSELKSTKLLYSHLLPRIPANSDQQLCRRGTNKHTILFAPITSQYIMTSYIVRRTPGVSTVSAFVRHVIYFADVALFFSPASCSSC